MNVTTFGRVGAVMVLPLLPPGVAADRALLLLLFGADDDARTADGGDVKSSRQQRAREAEARRGRKEE